MAAIIATIALVLFVNGILIPEAGNWFLDALVKMPKFEYTFQNGEQGNENFQLYVQLRGVAFLIIAIALTYTAVILMGEEFEVYRKGEAFSTLARGLLFIVVIFTFPAIWDLLAGGIEGLAKYVINPNNPNNPQQKVSELMQYIGGIVPPNIDWDDILQFLTDPNSAMQTIFRDVFMAVFKAVLAALLMVLMFLIGTVRIVLTGILAIALPLILALSLVPYFRHVMDRLKNVLVGLLIAPVLSGLTVSAGLALIHSTNFSPLQQWFAAVAIAFLAIFMPTITAPIVGSLVTSMSAMATGAVLAGAYFGGSAVMGAVRGAYTAITGLQQAGMTGVSPFTYAKAAITGAGSGFMHGLGAGAMRGISEALRTTGFGRLAEPFYMLEKTIARRIPTAGLGTANEIVSNYTGHVTEGLIPLLTMETEYDPAKASQSQAFANKVDQLAKQGKYEDIADYVNSYLGFKSIPRKAEYGRLWAEQINAYGKNAEAITRLYTGLEQMREKGGVSSLTADQLADLVYGRDMYRDIVAREYGIEIPNPAFEASSYMQLPRQLEATTPHLYEAKYALANTIANVDTTNVPKIRGKTSGTLQKAIRSAVERYWESKGIDTVKSAHIIDEFARTTARRIAKIYSKEPERIYALIKRLDREGFIPYADFSNNLKAEADKLLTTNDIHSIYERHKGHAEDWSSFFALAEKNTTNNNNNNNANKQA